MRAAMFGLFCLMLSGAAQAQTGAVSDQIIAGDIATFPDVTLVHADYSYPAGWTPYWPKGPGSRTLIADLNGDGIIDQAEPVIHKAKDLYSVAVWLGRVQNRYLHFNPPILIFERYLIPDLDIQLTRQGGDIGVVASKDGPMDTYRWTGQRFSSTGPDRLLFAPFPDYPLHPKVFYPAGWKPYPAQGDIRRLAMAPLDEDSQWDRIEVVLNAAQDRYGVIVWLSRGKNSGIYDNPLLAFERPLKPDMDVRLDKGLRTFTVYTSKDAVPEHFGWDGTGIVPVKK